MIKGVLFDMDGVLLDSEHLICQAAIQMFAEKGVKVQPSDFVPFVGTGEDRYLGGVAEKYGLQYNLTQIKDRTYKIYDEITKGKLAPLNGAIAFIEKCKLKGLKVAVATSADRVKMLINLKGIGLTENSFNATINGLEVEHKKPAPDIFIMAASKLGLKPAECLVVEDAINGVQAALSAGCKCLALTTSFTTQQLSAAHWIAKDLSEVPNEAIEW